MEVERAEEALLAGVIKERSLEYNWPLRKGWFPSSKGKKKIYQHLSLNRGKAKKTDTLLHWKLYNETDCIKPGAP